MGLTQYYTATTLDGFIADPNNSLDWLFTRKRRPGRAGEYEEFIADVGALAMGSTTYEWILDHEFKDKDPAEWKWPYEIPSWVFTHRELPVVPDADIEFVSGDVAPVHGKMVEAAGDRNVWIVGGGDLVGQFADAGLLEPLCSGRTSSLSSGETSRPSIRKWSRPRAAAISEIVGGETSRPVRRRGAPRRGDRRHRAGNARRGRAAPAAPDRATARGDGPKR